VLNYLAEKTITLLFCFQDGNPTVGKNNRANITDSIKCGSIE
jgi:hypothetical protein